MGSFKINVITGFEKILATESIKTGSFKINVIFTCILKNECENYVTGVNLIKYTKKKFLQSSLDENFIHILIKVY